MVALAWRPTFPLLGQSPHTREARGMLGRARNSSDGDGARYNMIYCTVHTDNEDPALLNQAMGDATVGRHRYRRGRARTRAHTYAGADRASITHPGGTAGQTTHTASERSSKAPMLHGNNEGPKDRGSAPRSPRAQRTRQSAACKQTTLSKRANGYRKKERMGVAHAQDRQTVPAIRGAPGGIPKEALSRVTIASGNGSCGRNGYVTDM